MSEPLRGIVVSHAAVAQSLVTAVAAIAGVEDALVPVSNEGCDGRALTDRLTAAIGGKPAVLFVDLPGGSCLTGAVRYAHGKPDLAVVTGVNLAMLRSEERRVGKDGRAASLAWRAQESEAE